MNLGKARGRYEILSQARGFLLCPRLCTRDDFFPPKRLKIPGKQSSHQKTEGLTVMVGWGQGPLHLGNPKKNSSSLDQRWAPDQDGPMKFYVLEKACGLPSGMLAWAGYWSWALTGRGWNEADIQDLWLSNRAAAGLLAPKFVS